MNLFRKPAGRRPVPVGRARLALTALDDRAVPAVGALGLVDGNSLTVVGDDTDNTIVVRETDGQLTIDGGRFATAAGLVDSVTASSIGLIVIQAGAGNDAVFVDADIRVATAITGGEGDDTLVAGGGPTEMSGLAGNDLLYGGRGDDTLFAGDGNDTVVGGGGRDVAFGGTGTDTFTRSTDRRADAAAGELVLARDPTAPATPAAVAAATPVLTGFRQPAVLTATLVGDVLQIQGTAAADSVRLVYSNGRYALADGTMIRTDAGMVSSVAASAVRDVTVLAYDGDDSIDLSAARVTTRVIAGNGADMVLTGAMADIVFGGGGADSITTGAGNDLVYAGSGNDNVSLGAGDDTVYGGAGVDVMNGGAGRDVAVDWVTEETLAGFEPIPTAPTGGPGRRGPGRG